MILLYKIEEVKIYTYIQVGKWKMEKKSVTLPYRYIPLVSIFFDLKVN